MLKYTGTGFIRGVPARDLTDEEARKYGRERLIKSGLYEETERKARRTKQEKAEETAEE